MAAKDDFQDNAVTIGGRRISFGLQTTMKRHGKTPIGSHIQNALTNISSASAIYEAERSGIAQDKNLSHACKTAKLRELKQSFRNIVSQSHTTTNALAKDIHEAHGRLIKKALALDPKVPRDEVARYHQFLRSLPQEERSKKVSAIVASGDHNLMRSLLETPFRDPAVAGLTAGQVETFEAVLLRDTADPAERERVTDLSDALSSFAKSLQSLDAATMNDYIPEP